MNKHVRRKKEKTWVIVMHAAAAFFSAVAAVFDFTEADYFEGIVFTLAAIVNVAAFYVKIKPSDEDEKSDGQRIEYYCPNCGAILDDQQGFEPSLGTWECTECGHENIITEDDVE